MTSFFPKQQKDDFALDDFSRMFLRPQAELHQSNTLLGLKQESPISKGYFAFPPPSPIINAQTDEKKEDGFGKIQYPRSDQTPNTKDHGTSDRENTMESDAVEMRLKADRQKRLDKEREMATQGEFEWVRSGGVLRDASGRRDKVRTESIREEIRLQEREKLLMDRWATYERKWHALLEADTPISFKDIPWPLATCPSTVDDLTSSAISDFLLEPLQVRTNTVSRRERIRTSMLRWHPDKISDVLGRVIEDDERAVREGIGAVFVSLKRMKEN